MSIDKRVSINVGGLYQKWAAERLILDEDNLELIDVKTGEQVTVFSPFEFYQRIKTFGMVCGNRLPMMLLDGARRWLERREWIHDRPDNLDADIAYLKETRNVINKALEKMMAKQERSKGKTKIYT